ncbi:hypothetical protein ROSI111154_00055 [Rouxiella silvae]
MNLQKYSDLNHIISSMGDVCISLTCPKRTISPRKPACKTPSSLIENGGLTRHLVFRKLTGNDTMKSDYLGASRTAAEHKDSWQTPIEIYEALDFEFNFALDVAANQGNALCQNYLTKEDNSLSCDWITEGAIWCNPPYSKISPWIKRANLQSKMQQQTVVMLLPADTSTRWFSEALETVNEVRLITGGRIGFISSATGKPGKNGNSKGSMLLIWRPQIEGECLFSTVSRDELVSFGLKLREVSAA